MRPNPSALPINGSQLLVGVGGPGAADVPPGLDQRMHQLLDGTVAFAALLTPDGLLKDVSQNALDVGGLSREEVVGRPFPDCFWWGHDAAVQAQLRQALGDARAGRASRYDTVVRVAGDGRLAIAFQLAPIVDAAGAPIELLASAFDITERLRSQQRAEKLPAEMGHRVKNLLATVQVQAMARVMQRSKDPAVAFDEFVVRLDALAAAHEVPREDAGALPPRARHQRGQVRRPVERGGAGRAYPGRGRRWRDARLAGDRGPGGVTPRRASFGTRFVTGTLESIFGGPVSLDYDPGGLRLTVSGPATGLFLPSGHPG